MRGVSWRNGHKAECKFLPTDFYASSVEDALLISRVLKLNKTSIVEKLSSTSDSFYYSHDAKEISRYLGCENEKTRINGLLNRFNCNNFAVLDDLQIGIGAGIYDQGALLNHSCDSNCMLSYSFNNATQQTDQHIRTIVDIEIGEELCHSYCDTAWHQEKRRSYLQETYEFWCDCYNCTNIEQRAEIEIQLLKLSLLEVSRNELMTLYHKTIGVEGMAVVCEVLTMAFEDGNVLLAKEACERLVQLYRKIYKKNHPLIALQLYTLGDLKFQTDPAGAIACFQEALAIFKVAHGGNAFMSMSLTERIATM